MYYQMYILKVIEFLLLIFKDLINLIKCSDKVELNSNNRLRNLINDKYTFRVN